MTLLKSALFQFNYLSILIIHIRLGGEVFVDEGADAVHIGFGVEDIGIVSGSIFVGIEFFNKL